MSSRIVCFGELLLRLSAPNKELLLQRPELNVHVGGAEANVAVSLAALGDDAAFVSAVPANALGRACIGELRRYGVDTHGVAQRAGEMGLYFLTQGALQRPAEVLYQRSHSVFAQTAANAYDWNALLSGAGWLHISGITPAVSAQGAEAVLDAAAAASRLGVKVSLDCNYRSRVWDQRAHEAPHILKTLCGYADLLFADVRDLALIFKKSLPTNADEHAALRATAFNTFSKLQWMAALQRRSEQVDSQELSGVLYTADQEHRSRAYQMSAIVDRIGAGDAFAAGILHARLRQQDPLSSLEFGVAAACLKHSIPGDFNLATEEDVQQLLTGALVDVRR
jgi:2-dehydro-3-deoxygluconokinase